MYSQHAMERCQQRGIQQDVVDALLAYGRRRYRKGAEVYFMTKSSRLRARQELGQDAFAKITDRLNSYLVVSSDGNVITATKRLQRLKF